MILDPKAEAVKKAHQAILRSIATHLDTVLPPIMREVFEAGGIEYAAALQRAMHSMPIGNNSPYSAGEGSVSSTPSGEAGKDGRAPRGAVRKAVTTLLLQHPAGLPLSSVMKGAAEIDPNISEHSASNELNRNKGTLYTNDGGVWRLAPSQIASELN